MSESPDQLSLNIKLDDSVSLDKFIECDSNIDCLTFLRNTLKEDSISNLFYIWGREGVGKSYIMQALNREFINLDKRTFHLSLNDKRVSSHEILQNLESLDVVLIENIDSLPNDEEWETQIFSLINNALTSKIKIYLSSSKVSKELQIGLKDLQSRLSYFTAIEIPEISHEEKLDALSQSSARKGIDLDAKTKEFIINNTSRGLSDLLQLLNDLDVYSLKKKKRVTTSLIRQLLKVRSDNLHK